MLVVETCSRADVDLAAGSSETYLGIVGRVGMAYSYWDREEIARTWPLEGQCCGGSSGTGRAPCHCGSQAFGRAVLGSFRTGDLSNQGDLEDMTVPVGNLADNQENRVMFADIQGHSDN